MRACRVLQVCSIFENGTKESEFDKIVPSEQNEWEQVGANEYGMLCGKRRMHMDMLAA
jgi:hypothetical protein